MPVPARKPRLAGGEKSLNTAVRHALSSPGAPPSLRAAVAVDLIKTRLERTYPDLKSVPPASRYLVPAHLIHPSLRVLA